MCRSRFVILVLVVAFGLISFIRIDRLFSGPAVEAIGGALSATGATAREMRMNGWVKLSSAELSDTQLVEAVESVMLGLGAKRGSFYTNHVKSERHRVVRAELVEDKLHIVVSGQVIYPVWQKGEAEAYIVVNVETGAERLDVAEWYKKVGAVLSKTGNSPQITTCLVGWLDGKLDRDEWVKRLGNAADRLNVTDTDMVIQPDFISMTAFSPMLPEWMTLADKRVNVNMAIRYSYYDNRTYVMIGSPVITGEY